MRIDSENGTLAVTRAIRGNSREKVVSRARLRVSSTATIAQETIIVYIGVLTPLKNTMPLYLAKLPLKSANCPSAPFQAISPRYCGFLQPPPVKIGFYPELQNN